MKKTSLIALILITVLFPLPTPADEGMWTFDNPPRKQWKELYKFEPSDAWLEHIRLASVKIEGSSGCLFHPDGLVLTNQTLRVVSYKSFRLPSAICAATGSSLPRERKS